MSYSVGMIGSSGTQNQFNSIGALRKWLVQHSQSTTYPLWVVIYKKNSGKQTLSYEQVLEEAICSGLIDTQTKTIDNERYAICLRLRKLSSSWTETNKSIAKRMIRERRMTEAGIKSFSSID